MKGWHVTDKVAPRNRFSLHCARAGYCCSIAALLVFCGSNNLQNAIAQGETRTISFHHMHTDEELTVTYKVNGRYDEEALRKINNVLRDWRESKTTAMDPHLIDLLWEVHREAGGKGAIWVVCGYRSPETNSMLRRRSSGVAQFSQHMLGKAIDFYIPGVSLEQLREAGLRAQRGGVGFYPTSGSPFVHMDTGSVRHWPRMPEPQLASVLAKGQLNSQLASDTTQRSRMPGMLARLFGGRGQAEDTAAATGNTVATPRKQAEKPPVLAAAAESRSEKVALPVPPAKPAKPIEQAAFAAKPAQKGQLARSDSEPVPISARYEFASMTSKSVGALQPASLIARASISAPSTSANEIINERGYWQGLPGAEAADTAQAGAARPAPAPAARRAIASAAAAPWPLADRSERDAIPNALAYAAQPIPIADAGALSMGSATARAAPAASETTIAVKRSDDARTIASPRAKAVSMVRVGDQFNDPWMRAMIVSPSAQNFMKTTMYGMPDFRALGPYLQKPPSTMMATFSEDPHRGMMTETFSGSAVGFTRTVTFAPPRTASLR
ncbi:MAG: DUF882 domain-containing protein [Alphaproteobacteria bacterium]|nr:MAG: DUF882 domain-containing protein [Alphaproteobacteria bacterium]